MNTPRASLTYGAAALDHALGDMTLPAWIVDRDGRFRWLNDAAITLLGPAVGTPFIKVVAPEHVHTARLAFARKLLRETTSDLALTLITASRERTAVRVASVPLRQHSSVVAVFGVAYVVRPTAKERMDGRGLGSEVLTARQLEVLVLLAEGLTTRRIADRIGVAHETARNHVQGLLRALNVHSRLHAVIRGYQLGLIPDDRDV